MPGGSPPLPTSSPSLIARCRQRARCAGALRIVLSEELRVRHAALSARTRRASSCIYAVDWAWKSGLWGRAVAYICGFRGAGG